MLLTDNILRDAYQAAGLWGRIPLDGLVSKWAGTKPDHIALVGPANLGQPSIGNSNCLDWQALDRAINGMAGRLVSRGLKADDIVAWQCGNTVDAVIAMLGILRARMIAVPLPPLWSSREISRALLQISPSAIIAGAAIDDRNYLVAACEVAVDVFSIRHVFGFGPVVPDGVTDLDDIFGAESCDFCAEEHRDDEAEHIATMCWWTGQDILPRIVARSHNHWIAAGLGPVTEAQITGRDVILSANFMTGLSGIGSVLVPWLLSGSRLVLHQPFDLQTYFDQIDENKVTLAVLPAHAAMDIPGPAETSTLERMINIWPDLYAARQAGPTDISLPVIDVYALGEAGIITRKRDTTAAPGQVPVGRIRLPTGVDDPPCLIETRIKGGNVKTASANTLLRGELQVSGPMVPATEIGAADQRNKTLEAETQRFNEGFVCTGIKCRITTTVPPVAEPLALAPAPGAILVGGFALSIAALEALFLGIDGIEDVAVYGYDDKILGQRIGALIVANAALEEQSGSLPELFRTAGVEDHNIPDRIDPVAEILRDQDGNVIFSTPPDRQSMSG